MKRLKLNRKSALNRQKVLPRYEEDLWGKLSTAKKGSRVLRRIYNIYVNDFAKRKSISRAKSHLIPRRKRFNYSMAGDEIEFKRRRKTVKSKAYLDNLKFRKFYTGLKRSQFKRLYLDAGKKKAFSWNYLLLTLESRLEVVLYRTNLFNSVFELRQMLIHGNIFVNGKVVNKPNVDIKFNDLITIKPELYRKLIKKFKSRLAEDRVLCNYPKYIEVDYSVGSVIMHRAPRVSEIPYPFKVNLESLLHGRH